MRKTVLVTIQNALGELGQNRPQIAVSSEDQEVLQMLALTHALCEEVAQMHNWNELLAHYSFTTVPGQEAYNLPYDFSRLANSTVWDDNAQMQIGGPVTNSNWAARKHSSGVSAANTQYRISGNKLVISPTPTTARTISFDYISAFYVVNAGDFVRKAEFTNDADNHVFDDRLIVNGLKLKYSEAKGFDTSTYLSDFNRSLEAALSFNGSSGPLNMSGNGNGFPLLSANNLPSGTWK